MCTKKSLLVLLVGFFTPFIYIRDNAIRKGSSAEDATMLLPVLGLFNVIGRVVAGWLSDQQWADCLFIHNFALIIAGGATCLVPLMSSHGQFIAYSAVFGCCIGKMSTATSIIQLIRHTIMFRSISMAALANIMWGGGTFNTGAENIMRRFNCTLFHIGYFDNGLKR